MIGIYPSVNNKLDFTTTYTFFKRNKFPFSNSGIIPNSFNQNLEINWDYMEVVINE